MSSSYEVFAATARQLSEEMERVPRHERPDFLSRALYLTTVCVCSQLAQAFPGLVNRSNAVRFVVDPCELGLELSCYDDVRWGAPEDRQ